MPNVKQLVAVTLLAVLIAWAASAVLGQKAKDDQSERINPRRDRAVSTAPGAKGPVFYLDLRPRERLIEARRCLDLITAGKAVELGSLKDDLALLSSDPAVLDLVIKDFGARAHLNHYEGEGFANVFALIRNPKLIGPIRELMRHAEFSVRQATLHAVLTQGDPSLLDEVLTFYEQLDRDNPGQGLATRTLVVDVAQFTGGALLPAVIDRALKDGFVPVRIAAAQAAAVHQMRQFIPRLEEHVAGELKEARYEMAVALADLGAESAWPVLYEALESKDLNWMSIALEAILRVRPVHAALPLERTFLQAGEELRGQLVACLAAVGHFEPLRRYELVSADDPNHLHWLTALAVRSSPEDCRTLKRIVAENKDHRTLNAIVFGLLSRVEPPDPDLGLALLESGRFRSIVELGRIGTEIGPRVLPWIEAELRRAETFADTVFAVDLLSVQPTEEARNLLLALRTKPPESLKDPARFCAHIEQKLRLYDLALLRMGRPLPLAAE